MRTRRQILNPLSSIVPANRGTNQYYGKTMFARLIPFGREERPKRNLRQLVTGFYRNAEKDTSEQITHTMLVEASKQGATYATVYANLPDAGLWRICSVGSLAHCGKQVIVRAKQRPNRVYHALCLADVAVLARDGHLAV